MNRAPLFDFRALAATVGILAGTPAHAQLGGASGIVIPYAGKLELDGALVTDSVDFEFGVAPNASDAAPDNCVFARRSVPITHGEFAVSIAVPVAQESCVKGKDVHLVVRVARSGDALVLLGRQRVTPVVGALTSGPGDFAVAGALTATTAAVTGALTATTATVTGALAANTATVTGALTANTAAVTGALTAHAATVTGALTANAATVTGALTTSSIVGTSGSDLVIAPTGDRIVQVNGPLTVTGPLGVGYTLKECSSFGAAELFSTGFCTCPTGTVPLGGAVNCSTRGSTGNSSITSVQVNFGAFVVPAFSYLGTCTTGAPVLVQVTCAKFGT
jgi:hypothetical protein